MNYRTAPAFYKTEITLMRILIECCKEFDIPIQHIAMKRKTNNFLYCRYTYFHLAKKLTIHSLSEIGNLVARDHATVLNGLEKYKYIPELNKRTQNVERKIN